MAAQAPNYTNKLALAGMLITAEGRVDGKSVIESTAKKYVGVMSANNAVEKYGFYVAGMTDSASSDKTFRKFEKPADETKAKEIMTVIQNIIPAANTVAQPKDPNVATVAELDNYLSYSGSAANVGRSMGYIATAGYGSQGAKDTPAAITQFNAAIPNNGFAFWDKLNSTFQLFLEYNKGADKITTGIGYLQFSGGRGLRNEQFKITDNVVQFSKGANVAIIKLIQDLVGAGELTVADAAVAGVAGQAPGGGAAVVPDVVKPPVAFVADGGVHAGDGDAVQGDDEPPAHMLPAAANPNAPFTGVGKGGKKTRRKRKSNKKKGGTRPRRQNKSTKKGRRSQRKKK